MQKITKEEMQQRTYELLEQRGVSIDDIATIVYDLQVKYLPALTREMCVENVHAVLKKRETQHAVITGIEMDIAAEKGVLSPMLTQILMTDEGLYGIDEILALSIANIYGTICLTNFGYLDKEKPGIISKLNAQHDGVCNTFIDDIVCAIAAAAASRIGHSKL